MVDTYGGNPASNYIDAIRLEIGKAESIDYLSDTEIAYVFATQGAGNVLLTAAFCCDKIVGMLSIDPENVDQSMDGSSASKSQLIEWWTRKAEDLRRRAMSPSITPRFSGSGSRTLKFRIGQHDTYQGVTDSDETVNTDWRSV